MLAWDRLPFVLRLLVTASSALILAGAAMLWLSTGQEAREANQELAAELERELASLPLALAEIVVLGDFATLEQTLQAHVKRQRIAVLGFIDSSGVRLSAVDPMPPAKAPRWFRQWLAFHDLTGEAPVLVGGRSYGRIEIVISAQPAADRSWRRTLGHLGVLLLAIMIDFFGIWWVLRSGLSPLGRLEEGVIALAEGRLNTRLAEEGAPEIRRVLLAFNRMAEAIEQSEHKLRQSEQRLAAAIEGAELGLWDWHVPSGRIVINARWAQMLGYEPQQIDGDVGAWEKLVHPADWPQVQEILQAHLRGESESYRCEHRLQHRDGHWVWVLDAGRVTERNAQGQVERMVGVHLDISALKSAEARLMAREQHLRTLIGSMDDAVLVIDTAGRIAECHLPARTMQGCPSCETMLGRDYGEVLPSPWVSAFGEAIAGLIEDGQPRRRLLNIECQDERRELDAMFSALTDGAQWPRGFLCIARDITEQRQRSAQNQLLVAALEAAANGVVITNREAVIEWANPAFARLTGYAPEEAIGHRPKELVRSGLQSEAFYRQMWATILAGEVWRGELINRRRDGSLYHEELTITPVADDDGQIQHFIAIKQDITLRKREEEAIRAAQREIDRLAARIALLLDSAGEGIIGIDLDGRCVFINPAALAMLGLNQDAALGADLHTLIHYRRADGTDFPAADCPIMQTLQDGMRRSGDEHFVRSDGSLLPTHVTVAAMHEDGQQVGAVVVFEDVTARRAMEEELRRLANTDGLTGVANRRYFVERLENELARVRRFGVPASLLMLDLDYFKHINDRWGHAAGDMVLKSFATLTLGQLRRIDLLGRLGGEEFAILLPGTDRQGARELAERVRQSFAGWRGGQMGEIMCTVSIGITELQALDVNVDSVLAHADAALYRAKETGRNRVELG